MSDLSDLYSIVKNTFIMKDKGEKHNEREIEIGDGRSDAFHPQIKIKRWNNECNFSVRLIDDDLSIPQIETDGNKIKFIKNKLEAHFYPCKAGEKGETDAYEFEIILKERPTTNIINMSIKTKGLKFYYQPPLNEEIHEPDVVKTTETDCYDVDGNIVTHRPENIIGSYAVYHESRRGNYSKIGGKNYFAGIAFQIYRPKIFDAGGHAVWGTLNIDIEKNLLTIEIPQKFLDAAVYPVSVDPNFGYEVKGGTVKSISLYSYACKYTITENGTAESITWYIYLSTANPRYLKIALYESDYSLIEGGGGWIPDNHDDWHTTNLDTQPALTGSTAYFLAGRGSVDNVNTYYNTIAADWIVDTNTFDAFPEDPFTPAGSGSDRDFSVFCTYSNGGAAATPKSRVLFGPLRGPLGGFI